MQTLVNQIPWKRLYIPSKKPTEARTSARSLLFDNSFMSFSDVTNIKARFVEFIFLFSALYLTLYYNLISVKSALSTWFNVQQQHRGQALLFLFWNFPSWIHHRTNWKFVDDGKCCNLFLFSNANFLPLSSEVLSILLLFFFNKHFVTGMLSPIKKCYTVCRLLAARAWEYKEQRLRHLLHKETSDSKYITLQAFVGNSFKVELFTAVFERF